MGRAQVSDEERSNRVIATSLNKLNHILKSFFYDPRIMAGAKARFDMIEENGITATEFLSVVSVPKRRIGEKSAYGMVFTAGFNNDFDYAEYLGILEEKLRNLDEPDPDSDLSVDEQFEEKELDLINTIPQAPSLFVVKYAASESQEDMDAQIHEFLVGLELNQLRNENCPYFMYTYSMQSCGGPQFAEGGSVLSVCSTEERGSYISLEEISAALTSRKYFAIKSNQDEISAYLLVLTYALEKAFNATGFTHGDLHGENVLIRDHKMIHEVPVMYKGKIRYIKCKGVPTVIDYGFGSTNKNPWKSNRGGPRITPVHDLLNNITEIAQRYRDHPIMQRFFAFCTNGIKVDDYAGWFTDKVDVTVTISEARKWLEDNVDYDEIISEDHPMTSDLKEEYHIHSKRNYTLEELISDPDLQADHLEDTLQENQNIIGLERYLSDGLKDHIERGLSSDYVEQSFEAIVDHLDRDIKIRRGFMQQLE